MSPKAKYVLSNRVPGEKGMPARPSSIAHLSRLLHSSRHGYYSIASKIVAMPWPAPMHIVARPNFALRSRMA
jgi:hypothetical protein